MGKYNCRLTVDGILEKPASFVLFKEHGSYSLNFKVYFSIKIMTEYDKWEYESKVNYALNKILRENNVAIPYPQMDILINNSNTQ